MSKGTTAERLTALAILTALAVLTAQGCHNGRFWMKMSVRTSFSSKRPRTSARVHSYPRLRGKNRVRADATVHPRGRGRASARARDRASARTCVDTRRAAMGPHGRVAASARAYGRATRGHGGGNLGFTL
jgi:hypothetical protein